MAKRSKSTPKGGKGTARSGESAKPKTSVTPRAEKPASGTAAPSGGAPSGSQSSRTRSRRHEREIKRRQQRFVAIAVGVAVVAVIFVAVLILRSLPAEAPIPPGTLDRYDGIPLTVSDRGYPVLGNPNAPVRVEEFSSFSCPACAELHDNVMDDIIERVQAGIISYTFIPLTNIGGIPNSAGATQAALCAGEQGQFFEYSDALFSWQGQFGNRAFTQQRLNTGVDNFGLNSGRYSSCTGSSRINDVISAAQADARERGVSATPTTYVNGIEVQPLNSVDAIMAAIDTALVASGLEPIPLQPAPVEEPEVTPEVGMTPETEDPPEIDEADEPVEDESAADEAATPEAAEDEEPAIEDETEE
jgi:protein-disulfide isomerase